jgi:hypothetical protein
MTTQEYFKGMREHFGIDEPGKFMDRLYLTRGILKLDISMFDLWVTNAYGDYGSKGFSLGDEIEQKFGEEAKRFIVKLL